MIAMFRFYCVHDFAKTIASFTVKGGRIYIRVAYMPIYNRSTYFADIIHFSDKLCTFMKLDFDILYSILNAECILELILSRLQFQMIDL